MTDNNDDFLGMPGVPSQRSPQPEQPERAGDQPGGAESDADASEASTSDEPVFDRPGESGLGVPETSRNYRELNDKEEAAIMAKISDRERQEALDLIDEMSQEYKSFQLPKWLRRPVAGLLMLLIALFGLFATQQVSSALMEFALIEPPALRYTAYFFLFFFLALALFAMARLTLTFIKLETNDQVHPAVLQQLADRSSMHQALAREHFAQAAKGIDDYLKNYPSLTDDKERKRLRILGLDQTRLDQLEAARQQLVNKDLRADERSYLERFERDFQRHLDEVALARISKAQWQAGLATAATPNRAIDMAVVIAVSANLIADLCRIYNVKADRFSMLLVLGRVVTNAFVAGNLQELGKEGASALSEQLTDALGAMGAKLIGGVTSRATEGAVNAMLVRRLGRTTLKMLQPVRSKA